MAKKALKLVKRWNADGTISLYSRGKVVFKHRHHDAVLAFAKGWFGGRPENWGHSQFAKGSVKKAVAQ